MVIADLPSTDTNQYTELSSAYFAAQSKGGVVSTVDRTPTISRAFREVQGTGVTSEKWAFNSGSSTGGLIFLENHKVKTLEVLEFPNEQSQSAVGESRSSEMIKAVKNILDLSDTELADVFKASRKSVHNWTNTEQKPSKSKLLRILEVYNVVNTWHNNGFSTDSELVRTPADGLPSLLEMLSYDAINKEQILFLGSSLMLDAELENELEDPFA